jgi:hypothetical protein
MQKFAGFLKGMVIIMNNIELRLIAEKNWREEELLKSINIQGKKAPHKSVLRLMNSVPSLLDMVLCYNVKILKN